MKITIDGVEAVSYNEFINRYHKGLSCEALNAARLTRRIDVIKIEKLNMILLTTRSLRYKPKFSSKRAKNIIIKE